MSGQGILSLIALIVITAPGPIGLHAADQTGPTPPIICSADRRLTWDDFKAKSVRALDGARSAINHGVAVGCRAGTLQFQIQTMFLPDQSSVTYRIISSGLGSRVGLQHEQTHFDLAEIYARRLRKLFAEITDPCPRSDEDLNAMVDEVLRELTTDQDRYDDRTHFGELEAVQIEWAKRVAADLAALAAYADTSGGLSRQRGGDRQHLRARRR